MAATDFITDAQLDSVITTIATAVKTNTTNIANHIAAATGAHAASAISIVDAGGLFTATNVEGALAEVKTVADSAAGGGVAISDGTTSPTTTWSSDKIASEAIVVADSRINTIFGGSTNVAALLAEISETDAELIARIADTVAFTVVQSRSTGEKLQARQNIGVITSTTDFAAQFTAALA